MVTKFVSGTAVAALSAAALLATPAQAQITGTMNSTITLEEGCVINGDDIVNGDTAGLIATINFGTHTTLFTQANAQAQNSAQPITIQCSPNIAPTITFGAGDHSAQGGTAARAMKLGTGDRYVGYNLFTDANRNTALPVDGSITLAPDGTEQAVNVYASAYGRAGLEQGVYQDVVTVTITL